MGVLLYALLCGFLPFDDDNVAQLYKKIKVIVHLKTCLANQHFRSLTRGKTANVRDFIA